MYIITNTKQVHLLHDLEATVEIYADHMLNNKGFIQVSPNLKCPFIYTLSLF